MTWQATSGRTAQLPPNWPRIRDHVLDRDRHQCQWEGADPWRPSEPMCLAHAPEVDHKGDAADHDPANLRALCTDHHRLRTAAQGNAARWAHRRHRPRPRYSWQLDDE
jgi:5-methylcytosine-specific restriction protein A